MFLRISSAQNIDNLKGYPTQIVMQLQDLLTAGTVVVPDSKRANFYDVQSGDRGYFIYVSPETGNVILLATWLAVLQVA